MLQLWHMSWHRGGPEGPVELWPVGLVDPSDEAVVGHDDEDEGELLPLNPTS